MEGFMKFRLFVLLLFFVLSSVLTAQDEQKIRIAVRDSDVYVFHIELLQPGHGFNIYRQDRTGGEFIQLNEEPVHAMGSPDELPSILGERFEEVRLLLERENAAGMYLKLMTDRITGRFLTFSFPEVAEAMGRLFIDENAPIGEQVTYRFEFVNDIGEPTGREVQETVMLRRHPLESPRDLRLDNRGSVVTAQWRYPRTSLRDDDKIIRFNIYDLRDGVPHLINDRIIYRDAATTDYSYRFSFPLARAEGNFFMTAVDITGRESQPSETVRLVLRDIIPPSRITNASAQRAEDGVDVFWSVSIEPDVVGYHVFRTTDLSGEFRRITDELVDVLDPVYTDRTVIPGRTYYYRITAIDAAGNESEPSAAAMVIVADTEPPPAPTDLTAEYRDDGTVNATWSYMYPDARVRTFVLLRRRIDDDDQRRAYAQVNERDIIQTSLLDRGPAGTGFIEGGIYEYGIAAVDSARNFSDTTFVKVNIPVLTPPEPPGRVTAINHEGIRVNLSWNATTSTRAIEYRIFRTGPDGEESLRKTVPIQTRATRDEDIELASWYVYAVSAVDSVGNESMRAYSDTVHVRNFDPPREVRNVRIRPEGDVVRITWEPVPAPDIAGYIIYTSPIATGVYEQRMSVDAGVHEWIDNNPSDGMWYRVRAVDTSGNISRPGNPVRHN